MSDATATTESDTAADTFDALDQALKEAGPEAVLDRLIQNLDEQGDYRALLDALLLRARFDLGLPLMHVGNLIEIPEPQRSKYEERYVEAIRTVGSKLLDSGDIAGAWPYYRAIGESEPVARAIDAFTPTENDERLGQVIEVAFNHGVNPRRGYEMILGHYGTCSAITAFEHLPREEAVRKVCAGMLVRQLHEHLTANLRADISQRGQPLPKEGTSIPDLMAGREWLFQDEAYHIDVSHLSSTVRIAPMLDDPESMRLALELAEYGARLSPRHRYEGDPPFEDVFEDHRVYLRALLGEGIDEAVSHFEAKMTPSGDDPELPPTDPTLAAQVLVSLLARVGQVERAIGIASAHLAGIPEASLFCPGVTQLCQQAGRPDLLAASARSHGLLVSYAASILDRRAD